MRTYNDRGQSSKTIRQGTNYKTLVRIPIKIKQNWFLANSSHVVDLVFHLCGKPIKWNTWFAAVTFNPAPAAKVERMMTSKPFVAEHLTMEACRP